MMIKIGMRNLWRNKRRSFLASLAIGIGLASLIIFDGFWLGMVDNMINSVTKTYLGHLQVHHKQYEIHKESEFIIENYQKVIETMSKHQDISAYSTRVLSSGMINSAYDSSNIQLVGVNPNLESKISIFSTRMLKGKFLENPNHVIIGKKLSEKLQVDVGDRIVITTSDIKNAELSQGLFRVGGIYSVGQKAIDKFMVILHENKLKELLGIQNGVHEIVFKVKDLKKLNDNQFINKFEISDELTVKTWKELVPQVVAAINMYDISIVVMSIILLSLVSLGILNTMFMSLYERMFEFGVLRSLGTRSNQILLMITSEAFALALLSIIVGVILGLAFGQYLSIYGVDYSGIEFAEITFTEKIYFIFRWQQFIYFPVVIFIFTILISLYPGLQAVRITMAKALHKSL